MLPIDSLNVAHYDLDEVAAGTEFQAGTNVVTYVGEFDLTYVEPTEDGEHEFTFEYNGDTFNLNAFERTEGAWSTYENFRWFDGVLFGTMESGWLVKMTSDGEGLFLFTF